jgi:hypothetical protein
MVLQESTTYGARLFAFWVKKRDSTGRPVDHCPSSASGCCLFQQLIYSNDLFHFFKRHYEQIIPAIMSALPNSSDR